MDRNIFNSNGVRVAFVRGTSIFDLKGTKIYELKGANIHKPSGELVGHLNNVKDSKTRLDKSTDRLFDRH